ncbi:MAG: hypothetical protein GY803_12240 [Chloroflexi bacterium]|nr:hypothetical protein [Chloroflexota bacterium]
MGVAWSKTVIPRHLTPRFPVQIMVGVRWRGMGVAWPKTVIPRHLTRRTAVFGAR